MDSTQVDARKGLKITELPYILWLHLDRFQYDWQSGGMVKLDHVVEFPHVVDLGGYVDEGSTSGSGASHAPACHTYELSSVLVHLGLAAGGHHFNYTKSFEKGKWYDRTRSCALCGCACVLCHLAHKP